MRGMESALVTSKSSRVILTAQHEERKEKFLPSFPANTILALYTYIYGWSFFAVAERAAAAALESALFIGSCRPPTQRYSSHSSSVAGCTFAGTASAFLDLSQRSSSSSFSRSTLPRPRGGSRGHCRHSSTAVWIQAGAAAGGQISSATANAILRLTSTAHFSRRESTPTNSRLNWAIVGPGSYPCLQMRLRAFTRGERKIAGDLSLCYFFQYRGDARARSADDQLLRKDTYELRAEIGVDSSMKFK